MVRVASAAILAAAGLGIAQTAPAPHAAVPLDPVAAILRAFDTHSIVGVGDPHGNEQAAAFRVRLIRDRRVADVVDDIVVEFGNSRYQDVMDRFIDGEPTSDAVLRDVWQNTTVASFVWDRPIYEQFFRAVRDVNAARPRGKRLRVLLADPPIDWTSVRTADSLMSWLTRRDVSAASIVHDQVSAKRRRALLMFGEGHFWRHNAGNNLVARLEAEGTKVFTISTPIAADLTVLQPDVAGWPAPSIALLAGTGIGAKDFQFFFGSPGIKTEALRLEDQVDALLYLGRTSTMTTSMLTASVCADAAHVAMRLARMALDPGPPGSAPPRDRLKRNCAP
jgi:hypothetical protein